MVTERVRGSRSYSLGFFAGVGSRHETPALHGASHFLEHALFKGTRRRSAEQISAAVEEVGGDINAYTTKEYTCFYARVLAEDAALATDVLADMITESTLRSGDVESERNVIIDEISMHADDPADLAGDLVCAALLPSPGLGAPVIGSPDSIAVLSRRQLHDFWRRHYRPDNLVVAAVGAVDHDRLVEQLAGFPGLLEARGRAPQPRSWPAGVPEGPRLITHPRRFEQSTVSLAYPGPGLFDEDRFATGLLSVVLGGGMSSRLFVEVRERRGLAYGIEAGESSYSDAGFWSVDWQCAPGKVAEILGLVQQCLAEVVEHGVTAEELRRAQGQMRGQTLLSYESPQSRMSRWGSSTLAADDRSIPDLLSGYDAVTVPDVAGCAERLLSSDPVLCVVGPRSDSRPLRRLIHA
ncbi:putative Zn-dependent peptidase [Friedmanniella endophytica]|uniref:Putative Zn-dependent peptidase n=1 Tax=Microlunatus kandeliicorticis TaxID=1759536 RepID=A0A7W3IVZ4_9ACTN|nr:pitrilysin family protein [Microlunatus kandeliicorticis]MBA8796286.1 putative Zn-dependent peptidase [Microlunatus kandeliicorticis]